MRAMRVFISYSREDQRAVDALAKDVRTAGPDIWLDTLLTGGQEWWDEILAQIRSADVFVFALSASSAASPLCTSELDYALALGRPLLPVRVGDVDPSSLPVPLAERQWLDYQGLKDKRAAEAARSQLRDVLEHLPEAPPLPDPLPPAPPPPADGRPSAPVEAPLEAAVKASPQPEPQHAYRVQVSGPAGTPWWPFLGVLVRGGRPRGLALLLSPTHAATTSTADPAQWSDTILLTGSPGQDGDPNAGGDGHVDTVQHRVTPLPSDDARLALLSVDPPVPLDPDRFPPVAEPGPRQPCRLLQVSDDTPDVMLTAGHVVTSADPDRFTATGFDYSEYRTAMGSPILVDGGVAGIAGTTGTNTSVEALGPPALRAARRSLALAEPPSLPPDRLSPSAAAILGGAHRLQSWVEAPAPDPAGLVVHAAVLWAAQAKAPAGTVFAALAEALARRADPPLTVATLATGLDAGVSAPQTWGEPSDEVSGGPPLGWTVALATEYASRAPGESVVHARHLLAAAVTSGETPDGTALPAVLGVDRQQLRTILRQVIDTVTDDPPEIWDAILGPVTSVDLSGGTTSDLVDATRPIDLARDRLGMANYVRMLAGVVAHRQTPLPVSVGLFGAWGSGKSFFMGMLRHEIGRLAATRDGPYCHDIVQISFNAWHYSDTNLWASLGDEIFRQLAGPQPGADERRAALQHELDQRLTRRNELEAATRRAQAEASDLRARLDEAKADHVVSARSLVRAVLDSPAVTDSMAAAWTSLGIDDEVEQARMLARTMAGAPEQVSDIQRTLRTPWARRTLVATVAVLVVAGVLVLLAPQIAAALVALGIPGFVTGASQAVKQGNDGVRQLQTAVDQIRSAEQDLADQDLRPFVAALHRAEAEQAILESQITEIERRVGEIGRELAELSPGQRLYRFVAERAASDDYRSHLGLISTIRRDLEQLAALMREWRKDPTPSKRPIDRIVLYVDDLDRCSPEQVVDVLQAVHLLLALDLFVVVVGVDPRWLIRSLRDQYHSQLDANRPDEDRWWDATPHDYLEKIFNIPFVLPAMDKTGFDKLVRQLALGITDTSPDGDSGDDGGDEGDGARHDGDDAETAAAGGAARTDDAEGQTERAAAAAAPRTAGAGSGGASVPSPPTGASGAVQRAAVPIEAGSEVATMRPGAKGQEASPAGGTGEASALALTEDELTLLAAVAPLVETPRAATRLLNLYRMLRSTRDLSRSSRFIGNDQWPGEYQAVIVLLGMLTAHPLLLGRILMEPPRPAATPGESYDGGILCWPAERLWADLVAAITPSRDGRRNGICPIDADDRPDWAQLSEGLTELTPLITLPDLRTFQLWGPRVTRFSFVLSPFARQPAPRPPSPVAQHRSA